MAGLMGVTAFLSMWINNSAATSIMIPTAIAITDELQHHEQTDQAASSLTLEQPSNADSVAALITSIDYRQLKTCKT